MPKTFAIIGSCVSEDWYHFQDARQRLDLERALRYQPSSLISVTAEPVSMTVELGDNLKAREAVSLQMDFDKTFLPKMAALKPDVLIVELLYDSRSGFGGGILAVNGSWVTSNYILERSPMAAKLKSARHLNVLDDPETYLMLFRSAARKLGDFMRREIPDCQIILNRARWAEFHVDENGQLASYDPWEQNMYFRANLRLDNLEKIFMEEIECQLLTVDDVPIFADDRHIWGPSADHYVKHFYGSFARSLSALIAPDRVGQDVNEAASQSSFPAHEPSFGA